MPRIVIRYCPVWITSIHAARAAARFRKVLGIEVDKECGRYGEFRVLVDGEEVVNAGAKAALGILPPLARVVATVRERRGRSESAKAAV